MTKSQHLCFFKHILFLSFIIVLFAKPIIATNAIDFKVYQIYASDKHERSLIASFGADIVEVNDNYVIAFVRKDQETLFDAFNVNYVDITEDFIDYFEDFPADDNAYHSVHEVNEFLHETAALNPEIAKVFSIGKSIEGNDILGIKISDNVNDEEFDEPAALFLGTTHAREHLSTEVPLFLARFLVEGYSKRDFHLKELIDTREIFIFPVLNPDGKMYDIGEAGFSGTRNYQFWRKNRRKNSDASLGVDLNRNYDSNWGGQGSSSSPSSDTYHGEAAFSEPETAAIKDFILAQKNISVCLSYHTFSKLILYPWGTSNDPIADEKDLNAFKKIAAQMAQWTGYRPEQASDLYITSGAMIDWLYADLGIFGFTFELDPASMWNGGFYPGDEIIEEVFLKNINPALYLIYLADDPRKAGD
ncbi:MAG: M14 family metallopeptidase [Pseudomonadota bacterium]